MKNVQIIKKFNTRAGNPVTVTGTLYLEKDVNLDGDKFTTAACEISIDVVAAGHGSQGSWVREMTPAQRKQAPAGYTHICGKLGLTAEQAEIINSVRSELEQHPAWIAKQNLIAENEQAGAEYRAHVKQVDEMMGM